MHIHILGICGTFMGGIALLARAHGHAVTGCDAGVYPPMSTQLAQAGIALTEGYDPATLPEPAPDCYVIGNALSRGNALVEHILSHDLPYVSGPAWLAAEVLRGRRVLAVAGTHGKTTTASLLAHVLEQAGLDPGFLIGGVPQDFGVSARLGGGPFVVEADEYDTAFFDKRAKFVHYRPQVAVLNNLEYDHADIYPDLAAIEWQFHQLLRTVPGNGTVVVRADDAALARVLARGCWTPVVTVGPGGAWQARPLAADGSVFEVTRQDRTLGTVRWSQLGAHNIANALAALAAAVAIGVPERTALGALASFGGVRRRMECIAAVNDIEIYDDFAHHPTAIRTTLEGLRPRARRLLAVLDLRSNSMRLGTHQHTLAQALRSADRVYLHHGGNLAWDPAVVTGALRVPAELSTDPAALADALLHALKPGDRVLLMSNGAFGGLHARLAAGLHARHPSPTAA